MVFITWFTSVSNIIETRKYTLVCITMLTVYVLVVCLFWSVPAAVYRISIRRCGMPAIDMSWCTVALFIFHTYNFAPCNC